MTAPLIGRMHGRRFAVGPMPTTIGPWVWAATIEGRQQLAMESGDVEGLGRLLTRVEQITSRPYLRRVA